MLRSVEVLAGLLRRGKWESLQLYNNSQLPSANPSFIRVLEGFGILRLKPFNDLGFLDLPVGRLAGDAGDGLSLKVVVMRECLYLIVSNFEQYRECELCGS